MRMRMRMRMRRSRRRRRRRRRRLSQKPANLQRQTTQGVACPSRGTP
jgi:hypothetical protein